MRSFIAAGFLVLGVIGFSSCGYDGWVRYSCQEAGNWEKPECQKPQCVVTGTCSEYLLPEGVLDDQND